MEFRLRMTECAWHKLRATLFPGDGCESVAFALCGRHRRSLRHVLTVREVHSIARKHYIVREPHRLQWDTVAIEPLLERARREELGIVIVHSHPKGAATFSEVDDIGDAELFPTLYGWLDRIEPLGAAVMSSDGTVAARAVMPDGTFVAAQSVMVVGDDIRIWGLDGQGAELPTFCNRHERFLGDATTRLFRGLRVGVVGCSGTGSPVIEQLARLGVGELVLVDPGLLKGIHLNRHIGMRADEVGQAKVLAKARYLESLGLGTEVEAIVDEVESRGAVLALAGCDVVMGCMDSRCGRQVLNQLASMYLIPYFDLGVGLDVGDNGRVIAAQTAVHYVKPGGSSLLSRGMFTSEELRAERLLHENPEAFRQEQNYLPGIDEIAPTVVSIAGAVASRAVSMLISRLHQGFAAGAAAQAETVFDDHRSSEVELLAPSEPCQFLFGEVGKADTLPLLGDSRLGGPDLPPLTGEAS